MAATRLPDGSVVMRPSGQRAVTPSGNGTKQTLAPLAKGAGAGRGAGLTSINGTNKQPGRVAVSRTKR